MSSEVRSKLVILGGAIAMFSVVGGVCGLVESIHHWHLENAQACLGLAFGGGIVGLVMVIFGKTAGEQNSPSDSLHIKSPGENPCPNCQCPVADGSMNCWNCGTHLK